MHMGTVKTNVVSSIDPGASGNVSLEHAEKGLKEPEVDIFPLSNAGHAKQMPPMHVVTYRHCYAG